MKPRVERFGTVVSVSEILLSAVTPSFEITVSPPPMPDVCSLQLQGRIDYREAAAFRKAFLRELRRSTASTLVVELGALDRLDTSGLAVLVEAMTIARRRDQQMFLCAPSESVLKIFRLSGFQEALQACCSGPDEVARRMKT